MTGTELFFLESIKAALSKHSFYLSSFMSQHYNRTRGSSSCNEGSKRVSGRDSLNGIENMPE
jgi:hypothetical protein